jgi:5-formyltetrahydrofolate cyclo-ligase
MDELAKKSDAVASAEATDDAAKLHQLRRNKQALRKIIRSRIKSAYPTNNTNTTESQTLLLTKSNQVFSRLFELPQYEHAKSIGFFLSMPSGEIQTKHAIQQIVKDGKVLYVPRVGLDFELCDMDLIRCDTSSSTATVDDAADGDADGGGVGSVANAPDGEAMFYDSWPRNKWGIPEPPLTTTNVAKSGDIDLLIVPGLAFDTNGHRLGQGKLPRHADHFCTIDYSNLTPAAVAVEDLTR